MTMDISQPTHSTLRSSGSCFDLSYLSCDSNDMCKIPELWPLNVKKEWLDEEKLPDLRITYPKIIRFKFIKLKIIKNNKLISIIIRSHFLQSWLSVALAWFDKLSALRFGLPFFTIISLHFKFFIFFFFLQYLWMSV